MKDIRWKQRFDNYVRAFRILESAVELARQRELSNLEKQGLIQAFEFTHELAWKVLKDYLENKGIQNLIGSKDTTRQAFNKGLIEDGEAWMDMIEKRNLTSHTYNQKTTKEIEDKIIDEFFPAFKTMATSFTQYYEKEE